MGTLFLNTFINDTLTLKVGLSSSKKIFLFALLIALQK